MTQEEKEARRKKTKDQLYTAAVVIFAGCCLIAFYFIVLRYKGFQDHFDRLILVFRPIIIGFVMAFLMNPIMRFFERRFGGFIAKHSKSEKKAFKTTRMIATLLSLVILIAAVVAFIVAVVPELISTIRYLVDNIQNQIAGVLDWCDEITRGRYTEALMSAKDSELDKALDATLEWIEKYLDYDEDKLISVATSSVFYIYKLFFAIIIGMFVSVYVLLDKEKFKGQVKKVIFGLFKTEHANVILEISRKTSEVFYGFIMGKLVDSLIIGIVCYIAMLIMDMPYAVLCSVIIGVTNIIPVFGPYIGAVPTVIIIFLTEPWKGIIFLVFVIVLQQVDGNLIGPKILGDSTGISAFWVVVAVVVGGGLFGVIGMIVGVPVVALIYYLAARYSRYLLRKKGLPEDTDTYILLDKIDNETGQLVERTKEQESNKRTRLINRGLKATKEDKK